MKKENFNKEIKQIWLIYTKYREYYCSLNQLYKFEKTKFSDDRFIRFLTYTCWHVQF